MTVSVAPASCERAPKSADPGRALLRWLHAVDVPDSAVLVCHHTPVPPIGTDSIGIRLTGCLADLGLALPAQLLASGVKQIHVHACAESPDAVEARLAGWRRVFGTAVGLAAAPASRHRRRRGGPVFDMARPSISRRSLFGMRARCEPPFDLADDDAARGVAALAVLQRTGRAWLEPVEIAATDRVAVSLRADGCTACGVCVRACANGALSMSHSGGISVLHHDEDACRSDRRCIALCPEAALSATAELTLVDLVVGRAPVELSSVDTVSCPRCRARHPATDGALCRTCRFRTTNPFGSLAPPVRSRRCTGAPGPAHR